MLSFHRFGAPLLELAPSVQTRCMSVPDNWSGLHMFFRGSSNCMVGRLFPVSRHTANRLAPPSPRQVSAWCLGLGGARRLAVHLSSMVLNVSPTDHVLENLWFMGWRVMFGHEVYYDSTLLNIQACICCFTCVIVAAKIKIIQHYYAQPPCKIADLPRDWSDFEQFLTYQRMKTQVLHHRVRQFQCGVAKIKTGTFHNLMTAWSPSSCAWAEHTGYHWQSWSGPARKGASSLVPCTFLRVASA